MTFFTEITFVQVCLAAITVGALEHAVVRFAPHAFLRQIGYAA